MELINIIGSVGFPIFACILMFIRMDKQEERHGNEMSKMIETINNNTIAINKLSEQVEKWGMLNNVKQQK